MMVHRVMALYEWKERLAIQLGTMSSEQFVLFSSFAQWFESLTFDRQEPQEEDVIHFERRFEEVEACLNGLSPVS